MTRWQLAGVALILASGLVSGWLVHWLLQLLGLVS